MSCSVSGMSDDCSAAVPCILYDWAESSQSPVGLCDCPTRSGEASEAGDDSAYMSVGTIWSEYTAAIPLGERWWLLVV